MPTPRLLLLPSPCVALLAVGLAAGCTAGPMGDMPPATAGSPDDDGSGGDPAGGSTTSGGGAEADDGTSVVDGSSSEGGSDDTGENFILTPDVPDGIFDCDLFAQDCTEPNTKCMPWANDGGPAWNSTRCSPISPSPGEAGDTCTVEGSGVSGVDDCNIGLMCWNVDENGMGICEDMCTGSEDNPICEDPDDACSIANNGAIVLCLRACDPLIQNCEITNEVCYPINEDWVCAPDASGETGAPGDPCEFINACDPGSVCLGAAAFTDCPGATGCCSPVCDVMNAEADADCMAFDPGQSCEPWYTEGNVPPGYENVGVCALPA